MLRQPVTIKGKHLSSGGSAQNTIPLFYKQATDPAKTEREE